MNRRGTIILMTMIIVTLAGMIAVSLLFRVRAELRGEAAGRNGQQAYQAAMSGIDTAISVLKDYRLDRSKWFDNETLFKNQLVLDDGSVKWYFTVYAPPLEDQTESRYGVIDEAGKLNINSITEKSLAQLPYLDEQLLDCLLDWRDSDDEPRENGAELEYYGTLQPIPYNTRNGDLTTIEEMMFIKGFNASTVIGEDSNFNGLLDANEDDTGDSFPFDDGNGELDTGLVGLLTTYSLECNVDNEGNPRVSINDTSDENLEKFKSAGLSEQTIRFIELCIAEGNHFSGPAQLLEMQYELTKDHDQTKYPGAKKGVTISSGVRGDQLATVMDKLSFYPPENKIKFPGLVNINTASAKVLACLPEIDENLAQQIVSARSESGSDYETIAWLFTKGLVNADKFKKIALELTARSFQFRIRCVGFGLPTGQFCVLEAVVDFTKDQPRIIYFRDITKLGLPTSIKINGELEE